MKEKERTIYRDEFVNTSQYNRIRFIIEQTIREMVNTAALVRVDGVSGGGHDKPAGTVSATPLVSQIDNEGNAYPMASIPRMPYSRVQGGKAALIIDPVPGDQGVVVYCKSDSSSVGVGTSDSQPPASYRAFDQADGMMVGTVQNQAPSVWIEIKQDETITIHAPKGVRIETDEMVDIEAGKTIKMTAPNIQLNGAISMQSKTGGNTTATLTGTLNTTVDTTANGISLKNHKHSGVQTGSGTTGTPQ